MRGQGWRSRGLLGLGLAVALGSAIWWLLREEAPPQEKIRRVLLRAKQGVERKNLWQVMSCVSRDYDDGVNRYTDVLRGLMHAFRENDALEVTLWEPEIGVRGEEAEVSLPVAVKGIRGTRELSFRLTLHLWLRQEGRHWRVIRAAGWEPATPLGEEAGEGAFP